MRALRFSRTAVLSTFAAGAAAALIGCQHVLSVNTAAPMPTTSFVGNAPALQRLEAQKASFQNALYMPAATPSGAFEDAFKQPLSPPLQPATTPTTREPGSSEVTSAPAAAETEDEPEQQMASVSARPLVFESGVASTYGQGDGFEGHRTACGQIFHTHVVQVAHKSLPCGTIVRVEDVDTGKTVEAEVTDRGPYVAGRVVDLSQAAFSELDARGMGLLDVKVYVIDTSNQYLYRRR